MNRRLTGWTRAWLLIGCILLCTPLEAAEFSGPVVSVLDGDTIEVLHHQRAERIRLSGIDCPEKGQAYGQKAKDAVADLAFRKEVTLQTHGLDKYGRTLADVLLPDGTNVNHALVKDGWCWSICPEADNLSPMEDSTKTGAWPRSIEVWDKLCVGNSTTPSIFMVHIYLKDRPQMKFWADGIPFAQVVDGCRSLQEMEREQLFN